jgi:hypothetical protein
MFHFFPGNYMWSQAALRVLFTGGNPGDVVHIASQLQGEPAASADAEAWYTAWKTAADRVWTRAEQQARADHAQSARDNYLRACVYDQWSVSFLDHADSRRHAGHRRSVDAFGRWGQLVQPPAEYVDVAYLGGSFPAWYLPGRPTSAETGQPAVVYLPGWDSTKEQGVGVALALAERGIGTLLCDGPGVGEAVLFRGLVNRHDYEVPGAAAVDYLLGRADVDPHQVAVVGSSLGGYRAARMAAYESRLAAAVAWGAVWDFKRI